ncbi:MAG: hypothetical protein LBL86_06785 [Coriobacteriales bacterium]|nr:hypothetical protein [Coriobacteriales bacterium]
MTDTEKVEKVEALAEEVEELSEELSEDELEQVAGGGACDCAASGYGSATDQGGECFCAAFGAGTTSPGSLSNPGNLRCACSSGGFGADGADGAGTCGSAGGGGGGGELSPVCGCSMLGAGK